METYQIKWANTLPENCPPEDILVPENEDFYRLLINKDEIIEDDWKPYAELYPDKTYNSDGFIMAHGLSVSKIDNYNELIKKTPSLKDSHNGIAKVTLNPTDGVLKKTFGDKHYTWWRTTSFDKDSAEIINNEKD
jgi:hypothetical protein